MSETVGFAVGERREIRYRWIAEHWLDPTRDVPPMGELHEAVSEELDVTETERFGMV